jgi:hypothetical protein
MIYKLQGFTAFCQTKNSSIRLLVNCLLVQSEPMKVCLKKHRFSFVNISIHLDDYS